jgi:hypothetical protein
MPSSQNTLARAVKKRTDLTRRQAEAIVKNIAALKRVDEGMKRARSVQGATLCSIVSSAEKARVKDKRSKRGAGSSTGSRSSRSRAQEDPCESPTTLRKLILCMKTCCTKSAAKTARGKGKVSGKKKKPASRPARRSA